MTPGRVEGEQMRPFAGRASVEEAIGADDQGRDGALSRRNDVEGGMAQEPQVQSERVGGDRARLLGRGDTGQQGTDRERQ